MAMVLIIPSPYDDDPTTHLFEVSALPRVEDYVTYMSKGQSVKRRVKSITHDLYNNKVHVHLSL